MGAGPTGILASQLLTKHGVEVVLVEAGDFDSESMLTLTDYNFKSPSKMIHGVHKVGGGTNGWKGRVSRFPQSAIESKDKSGNRPWPIEWKEIETAYSVLAKVLNFTPIENRPLREELHCCDACEQYFNISPFQFLKPDLFRNLFKSFESNVLLDKHLRTYCKRIRNSENSLIIECEKEVSGSLVTINFEVDILFVAAGCLQSTALVKRSFPGESQRFPIGIYLQEHFDGYIGRLHIRKKDMRCLSSFALDYNRKLKNVEFGVGLSAKNHGDLHWHLEISPLARIYAFDPMSNRFNLPPIILKLFFGIERLISAPIFRVSNIVNRLLGRKTFSLWLKGEEFPYEKSELAIESENSKKVIYKHRVSRTTTRQMWVEINSFKQELNCRNLGKVVFSPYINLLRRIVTGANWHPLGSMRMHSSGPAVLNADLSLKFESRIFCIDSSSFPTGAHHNPTAMSLTLTTLAVQKLLDTKTVL